MREMTARLSNDGINEIREGLARVHREAGGAGDGYDATRSIREALIDVLDKSGCEIPETLDRHPQNAGYEKALFLVRGGHPKTSEVAAALGGASADGPQGNIWRLFDDRLVSIADRYAERIALEPGKIKELPPGKSLSWASGLDPNARAVLDVIEAHRLLYRAGDVLGYADAMRALDYLFSDLDAA